MLPVAAFAPNSTETAIFYIAAVVCFVLAALAGRFRVGALSLIGLGLALYAFPHMWVTAKAAF